MDIPDITRDRLMFIGGEWTTGTSSQQLACASPSSGTTIGTVPQGNRADIDTAVKAARQAMTIWESTSAFDRAAALERVADLVHARRDRLAWALTHDQGKPLHSEAYGEVDELVEYLRWAAGEARRLHGTMPASVSASNRALVYRVPRGVVGVIASWNWPYTMAGELIGPALAGGNCVIWTPAPTTAWCSTVLTECFVDADLPPGVFNVVTGEGATVGDALAGHPGVDGIGFIGSEGTGQIVATRAAGKAQVLELGGNGPMILFEDADVQLAAQATLSAAFLCAGQSCTAGERFLVHEAIHDRYVEALIKEVESNIRLGDPFTASTSMGPLNNSSVADKTAEHIADARERGAQIVAGGQRRPELGTELFHEPTILTGVDETMAIFTEETFGPVAPIAKFRTEAEALKLVNESTYGLLTAVWTADLARALRFAENCRTGWVNINETSNYWEPHIPFGGRAGKRSGIGRVGGDQVINTFTEPKTIIVNFDSFGSTR